MKIAVIAKLVNKPLYAFHVLFLKKIAIFIPKKLRKKAFSSLELIISFEISKDH